VPPSRLSPIKVAGARSVIASVKLPGPIATIAGSEATASAWAMVRHGAVRRHCPSSTPSVAT
jgi:hypothetical protein